jgi:hypothetical protein
MKKFSKLQKVPTHLTTAINKVVLIMWQKKRDVEIQPSGIEINPTRHVIRVSTMESISSWPESLWWSSTEGPVTEGKL